MNAGGPVFSIEWKTESAAGHAGPALQNQIIQCRAGPMCPAAQLHTPLRRGRCLRRPAHRTPCNISVGAGFSCPPSCQPIPGHCRVRQSGHFLETGSLHPPPAALRRFPRPREGQSPSPTHTYTGRTEASAPTSHSVGATLAAVRRHPTKKLLRLLPEEFL